MNNTIELKNNQTKKADNSAFFYLNELYSSNKYIQ